MASPIPVRIRKRHELSSPPRPVAGPAPGARVACEPRVQFLERSPGVYDIQFTCRCGEQSLIRVESLEK